MSQDKVLTYHTAKSHYLQRGKHAIIKNAIQLWWYKKSNVQCLDVINRSARLVALFAEKPESVFYITRNYVSNRLSSKQRYEAFKADCLFAQTHLPDAFFVKNSIELAKIDNDWGIDLHKNHLNFKEGIWSITLTHQGIRVYTVSFSVGYGHAMLLGSIQGATGEQARELIKLSTKSLHGLRPQQFIVWIALQFAEIIGKKRLEAVGFKNHIMSTVSRRYRKKHYFMQYDAIWANYDAEPLQDGGWVIPPMAQKTLDEVPTRKRSMYRKRYAMYERITDDLKQVLIPHC